MPAVVDLRSDTVTRPTEAMRRAIAAAEVGDMVLGDDPTVRALEEAAAAFFGTEAALFFPSGIMANLAAVLAQSAPAQAVWVEEAAHLLHWEDGGAAAFGGVVLRTYPSDEGRPDPADLDVRLTAAALAGPSGALLCFENTHNAHGGRVLPPATAAALAAVARRHGLAVHLDGARLPNACVATDQPPTAWTTHVDTAMVSLSKGLGAPVGSLLVGRAAPLARAARLRRRLGGGLRQAGLLAAAGLHALRHHWADLAADHRRAQRLAEALSAVPGLGVVWPETNIVLLELPPTRDPAAVLADLAAEGVLLVRFGPRRLRAVLHRDVDDAGVERAAAAIARAVAGPRFAFSSGTAPDAAGTPVANPSDSHARA